MTNAKFTPDSGPNLDRRLPTKPLLIKGATVVDPASGLKFSNKEGIRDILVIDGKITAIEMPGVITSSSNDHVKHAQVIDGAGKILLSGAVDSHVHLREPGFEYKENIETGTRAAVTGGFTAVACMANTSPVNDSPYVTAYIREKAKSVAHCDVHIVGALSKNLKGEELAEIGGMVREGARAISDDGMPVMNSYLMRKAMDYAKAFGVPILSHAEDANLVGQGVMNEGPLSNMLGLRGNPAAAEEIMVAREIALCRLTKCPVHICHLTTEVALEHVRRAKEAGLPITAEVSPHHLTLSEEHVRTYDTRFKMAPPLRSQSDISALIKGLNDGVIDVIASDHAPHGLVDKAVEFDQAACGILGLQTSLSVTYSLVSRGLLSVDAWVAANSTGPAKLLKLEGRGIRIGNAGTFTLYDPNNKLSFTEESVLSKSSNSPYLIESLHGHFSGSTSATVINGRIAYSVTNRS